jgi:hypothetical protein
VKFDRTSVEVFHNHKWILEGVRNERNGLWTVDLQDNNSHSEKDKTTTTNLKSEQAHIVYEYTNQQDLVRFLHAAVFSPVQDTWLKSIRAGHFATWPGLTEDLVRKHLPTEIATLKGHLSQRRKKLRSTTTTVNKHAPDANALDDVAPKAAHVKTHQVFAAMVDVGKVYGDLTGRFPIQSSSGHKYILTLYDYASNTISTEPMKNRTDGEMIRAYTSLHKQLINAGLKPELQVIGNGCSKAFRQYITDEHIDVKLVPPHLHRQNAAERAIQTFKNHFVAGLCSVDKQFPMHLWCELLPQATLTLNLLRTSSINPTIAAATRLFGQFDFNRTPLAPPGTRAVAHVKPKSRHTWAPHDEDAWYAGPAPDHYRCYKVWMVATNRTRIVDTVEFFPQHVKMPHLSSQEMAIQAARELTHALRNPAPAAPFARLGHQQHEALTKLANIFKEIAAPNLATRSQ